MNATDTDGNTRTVTATYTVGVPQSISFAPLPDHDHLVDNNNYAPDLEVTATASSGLAVSFSSSTAAACAVTSAGTVHLLGTGTCMIEASQAGNTNFAPAAPVDRSFRVLRALVMGPQAMEGDLKVAPGTTLRVGYDFRLPKQHAVADLTFAVTSVVFHVTCVGNASTGSITVPVAAATYNDPAGNTSWFPSGDQHSDLVYQGLMTVPSAICGTGVKVSLKQGGTFTTGIASNGTDKVSVRWHYSAGGSPGNWSGTASIVPS